MRFPRLSLTTKISGQITAEIQESLARVARRKLETQPDSKRKKTSAKQRGAEASQFCKQGHANTNRMTRPSRSSSASPSRCYLQKSDVNRVGGEKKGKDNPEERNRVSRMYQALLVIE